MCGGINLSQSLGGIKRNSDTENKAAHYASLVTPGLLYNAGRLVSYTLVGVAVGALGSVITVSGRLQGVVLLIAGVFMLIMGITMLGLFPALRRFTIRLPKALTSKIEHQKTGKGPAVVGFLNGFIPCGPLQAMQLFALGTASPLRGGIAMFLFCLGTIPLMFALGATSGILSGVRGQVFSRRVMYAGATLVAAMGLGMFANGLGLAGVQSPLNLASLLSPAEKAVAVNDAGSTAILTKAEDGVQIINSTLRPNRYPAIVVQQGIPVKWVINAPQGSINSCNNRFIVREYGIEHTFVYGDNVIEFTPEKTGKFPYSCWMGMIRSTITVVPQGQSVTNVIDEETPVPAGVNISTNTVAVAEVMENFQVVEIHLTDEGFEPAIVVMQKEMPALLNVYIEANEYGNSQLVFPVYYTMVDMEEGNNYLPIMPSNDFDFSTADNAFYGYAKIVDTLNNVDIEAIKQEVADFETQIYPESYFDESGAAGCACCS
jgi:sulfite exporter TauE/SafE